MLEQNRNIFDEFDNEKEGKRKEKERKKEEKRKKKEEMKKKKKRNLPRKQRGSEVYFGEIMLALLTNSSMDILFKNMTISQRRHKLHFSILSQIIYLFLF